MHSCSKLGANYGIHVDGLLIQDSTRFFISSTAWCCRLLALGAFYPALLPASTVAYCSGLLRPPGRVLARHSIDSYPLGWIGVVAQWGLAIRGAFQWSY